MQLLPFINTNAALQDYCQHLRQCDVIALDTEFLRVRTFYPKPGLFQVNDGENIALIDPLAITQWECFSAILADPNIVKVLHACDEDIELFHHFLAVEPVNIFDTQVAAAFCGYDFCMGYQRLVAAMFNVDIEKGESRSDWMQRPLSDKQIHYAAVDVHYLIDIYRLLQDKLLVAGHVEAVKDECDRVFHGISSDDFSAAYKRIKQAWKLNAWQFSVLKDLAEWREKMMRAENVPRNKVAKNEALMTLAQRSDGGRDWTKKQLLSVEGLPASTVNHCLIDLQTMLVKVRDGAKEVLPKPVKADPLLNRLKTSLSNVAAEAGIAEKMLAKKAYTEAVYYKMPANSDVGDEVLSSVEGWRRTYYAGVVAELAKSAVE